MAAEMPEERESRLARRRRGIEQGMHLMGTKAVCITGKKREIHPATSTSFCGIEN